MESKYYVSSNASLSLSTRFPVKRNLETFNEIPNDRQNQTAKKSSISDEKLQHFSNSNYYKKSNIAQYRKKLPVFNCRQGIMKELENNDTLLIMGETGSGKTTQIPQFLYNSGYNMIGITQPRRVAAITIAKRVAQELSSTVGDIVGYTVRFEDYTSDRTRIRFLTDGILLREAVADRLLLKYSVIMLDEAHERTVNTDILFGLVKAAQRERKSERLPKLKIIITSATMDIDHFGKYFNARGMYLEGRTFPVRVMHAKESQTDYTHAALVTLFELHRELPLNHDVLIFLTGQEEIETLAQQIRRLAKITNFGFPDVRVFTLYAQLSQGKQLECFVPVPQHARKIVLATNIAETSITIPGIRCVIDCGFVKQKVYNPSCGLDILRTIRISKAQAWQRSGRAGRDAPGVCYRIYTKEEMELFTNLAEPEILMTNLGTVAIQLLALGIQMENFDFLDTPSEVAITNAYKILDNLGAIKYTPTPKITKLGRLMVQFPLDPKYSKLLLSAASHGCMDEMLSLVAVLTCENIFVETTEKHEMAALAHAKFFSQYGDHLTILNVFIAFLKTDRPKLWCHENFLNLRNLTYARNVRNQLLDINARIGLQLNSCSGDYDCVRKCLLTGLSANIAVLQKDGFYQTISGQKARIHPSSVLHSVYKPDIVLFNEMVLTENYFLRQVIEINADWVAEVAPFIELVKKVRK